MVAEPASSVAAPAAAQAAVPRLIKFSGVLRDLSGKPLSGPVDVIFSLYAEEASGSALWFETQTVQADGRGNYTVLLGAMSPTGVPMQLFTSGEAHWLGVQVSSLPEQSRVLLVSVPYAMKAGDAETLGGKPASAYLLSSQADSRATAAAATLSGMIANGATRTTTSGGSAITQAFTQNYIPIFADNTGALTNSVMIQSGNSIGINTATPAFGLDLNSNVFAVGTKTAAPGAGGTMRFRDDTGTVRWLFGVPGVAGSQDFFMYNYSNGHAPLYIANAANSYSFYFSGNGNVGVLTNTPAFGLDVNTSVLAVGTKTPKSANGGSLRFRDDTGTVRWTMGIPGTAGATNFFLSNTVSAATPIFVDASSPSNTLYLNSAGRVGIGTAAPAQKLDVSGNLKITGLGNAIIFPDGSVMSSAATGVGGGDITGVTAGTGLSGGGTSGGVTLNIASNSCAAGQAMTGLPLSCAPFASLGANTFIGNQAVTGNIAASGDVSSATATISGALVASTGSFIASNGSQAVAIQQSGAGTALTTFADSASIGIFATANVTSGVALEGAIGTSLTAPTRSTGAIGINSTASGVGLSGIGTTSGATAGLFQSTTSGGQILSGRAGGSAGNFASGTEVFSVSYSGAVKGTTMLPALNGVIFSATPTFDASLGNTVKITLTGNVTSSTLSNATAGQTLNFVICQDATGGRTFVWPTNVLGGMAIGSTASKCSAQSFVFDGTKAYAVSNGVSNM